MSFENQEQHELNQRVEARDESQKKFKISYTRDFLLSLSELDVCKKLPSGFGQSILSEFEDASQDRFRISGGLSSQSYRRNEYGSSPPTRGDANNYSRGIQGRWDSRSSGRSDRDSDSQSDWDSDSGRQYGNQSQRPWQVPGHDGLLGSGSFPRPSGYAAGASGPKFRANDQYRLNRSNEPYHPPRPYKAAPHSRRDTNDSYNDETFGSSEYASEDRAEEERKRKASFELMRKEQQKAFQEKQKLNPGKGKNDFDFSELLEDPKDDERFLNRRNESDEPVVQPASNNVSDKSLFPSQAPVSRPLVPPGFSSTAVEKNAGTKSSTPPQLSEFGNELEGSLFHVKRNRLLSGNSNDQEEKQPLEEMDPREQQLRGPSIHASVNKCSEKIVNLSLSSDVSNQAVDKDNHYYETSKLPEPFDASENSEVMELDAKDAKGSKAVGESNPIHSTSILDKLFGSTLTLNGVGSSNITEQDVKAGDTLSSHMVQSSKFAQWFLEDERNPIDDLLSGKPSRPVDDFSSGRPNKPVDELSSGRTVKSVDDFSAGQPNHLLSLIVGEKGGSSSIVGSDKSGSHAFDVKASGNIHPRLPLQGSGLADGQVVPNSMPVTVETIGELEAVPAVLTCEDLEQSIMSEITENGPVLQHPLQDSSGSAAKIEQKTEIDDHASQHLLSLLQKGTVLSTDLGIVSSDRPQNVEAENLSTTFHNFREANAENISNAGKPLTLETLFGTAFMKELKSIDTPTSGQRGASVSMRVDVSESSFPMMDDDIHASTADIPSSMYSHGSSALASNQRQQITSERIGEQFLGFDPQSEVDLSQLRIEFSKLGGFGGSTEVRLPEEDSLIAANDPLNPQNFLSGRNLARAELLSTHETELDIAEKLAALNSAVYRDERTIVGGKEGPTLFHGPYDMREPDVQYHKIHAQSSSPQLHPSQLNHAGPLFHPLDSHPANINAQMKFMAPENIIHHDPPNHQFPANLLRPPFHHPSTGLTGLDSNPHNPMLQQMHIPGNFPPPHLLRGFPRSTPLPPHPNNQVSGFIQEPSQMQGFPFGQKQPNFGGLGIPPQAADVGSGTHHPEALQRLIEMELRSKQMHPFATASRGQGIHGHELDMSFRYR